MERPSELFRLPTRGVRPRRAAGAVGGLILLAGVLSGCGRPEEGQALPVGDTPTTAITAAPTDPSGSLVPPTSETSPTPSASTGAPPSERGRWRPTRGMTWQWQLNGTVDTSIDVQVYDIDLFTTPASVVDTLHARGRKVICYLNAGAVEDYRPDARSFPPVLGGGENGWPGEKWLDIRRVDVLKPIMAARFDLCKQKGFDGVEVDLVDGYAHDTGFPLTGADQLRYNRMLAGLAHERGLAIGLKNNLDQVRELVEEFDFAVNEQCHEFRECDRLKPFIDANKPVFHAEYNLSPGEFCPTARRLGMSSIFKEVALNAHPRQSC